MHVCPPLLMPPQGTASQGFVGPETRLEPDRDRQLVSVSGKTVCLPRTLLLHPGCAVACVHLTTVAAKGSQAGGPVAERPSRLMDPCVSRAKTFGASVVHPVSVGQGEAAVRWGPCQWVPSPRPSAVGPEGVRQPEPEVAGHVCRVRREP